MKHREFRYVGDPVPELNERAHAEFFMNIQRSILLSLEKRNLLTASERIEASTMYHPANRKLSFPVADIVFKPLQQHILHHVRVALLNQVPEILYRLRLPNCQTATFL